MAPMDSFNAWILFTCFNIVLSMHVNYVRQLPQNALSKTMMDSFYNFGDYFTTGIYDLQVPKLDPLIVNILFVEESTPDTQLEISCKQVTLSDLSTFQLQEADVNLATMSMTLLIHFGTMTMRGRYIMEGTVRKVFPLSGNGRYIVRINNATAVASANLEFDSRGRLDLNNFTMKYDFRRKRINQKFENIIGGGHLGEMANRILRQLGLHLFEEVESLLSIRVGDAVRKKALQTLRRIRVNRPILRSLRQMEETDKETMLANDYIDQVLHNVRLHIQKLNVDPYPLPDYGILKEGKLFGLSSMKREGDATVKMGDDEEIILDVILQMFQLKAEYIWLKSSAEDKGQKVEIHIQNATILLRLRVNNEPEAELKLDEFKIVKFGKTAVDLNDSGPLGWVFSGIINFSLNNFKNALAKVIEGPIKDILQYHIDAMDTSKKQN